MQQIEDCFHLGAKALIRNHEGKYLLLQKQHKVRGDYWDIPGGRLHKGESLLEALQRELAEETGLIHIENKKLSLLTMLLTSIRIPTEDSEVGLVLSIYKYDKNDAFTPKLSVEHSDFGWFYSFELAQLLQSQYPFEFIQKVIALD